MISWPCSGPLWAQPMNNKDTKVAAKSIRTTASVMKRKIVYIASPFLPHLLFKDYQGFYKREEQVLQNRKPPTGIKIPLEALYRNIPAISFHLILQKAKVLLGGLLAYSRETTVPKILLSPWVVKMEIASENALRFQGKIDDLPLKCGILEENSKNKTSGRTSCFFRTFSASCRIYRVHLLMLGQGYL